MAVIVCTALAIAAVPSKLSAPDALILPTSILTLGLFFGPIVAYFRNPSDLLRAEHLLLAGLAYFLLLDPLQGQNMSGISQRSARGAILAIGIFATGVWLAGLHRVVPLPKIALQSAQQEFSANVLFGLAISCFSLGMFDFAYWSGFDPIVMFAALGQNRWAAPWARGQLGGMDSFVHHLRYFGYLLPTLTVCISKKRGWVRIETVITGMFAVVFLAFIAQGGGRRLVGVAIGAAVICWVAARARVTSRRLFVGLIAAGATLLLMQFMLEVRGKGLWQKVYAKRQSRLFSYDYLHTGSNFLRLSQVVDYVPRQAPFVYEKQIVYALVRPIPRAIWKGKPKDPGYNLSEMFGVPGASLACTIVGEWYLTAGWIAVFFGGWLHGALARSVNQLRSIANGVCGILMYGIGSMVVFAGIRSMLDLVVLSYIMLAWLGVSTLVALSSKSKNYL